MLMGLCGFRCEKSSQKRVVSSGLYVKKLLVRIRLNGKNKQTHMPPKP